MITVIGNEIRKSSLSYFEELIIITIALLGRVLLKIDLSIIAYIAAIIAGVITTYRQIITNNNFLYVTVISSIEVIKLTIVVYALSFLFFEPYANFLDAMIWSTVACLFLYISKQSA